MILGHLRVNFGLDVVSEYDWRGELRYKINGRTQNDNRPRQSRPNVIKITSALTTSGEISRETTSFKTAFNLLDMPPIRRESLLKGGGYMSTKLMKTIKHREGTKEAAVIAKLRRPEGATIADIQEATGWQAHYADLRIMPT